MGKRPLAELLVDIAAASTCRAFIGTSDSGAFDVTSPFYLMCGPACTGIGKLILAKQTVSKAAAVPFVSFATTPVGCRLLPEECSQLLKGQVNMSTCNVPWTCL